MRTTTYTCILTLLLLAQACGGESSIRLTLVYDEPWELDELDVSVGGRAMRLVATHELLVMPDKDWDGQEIVIEVFGMRGGQRYAFGAVAVTPIAGAEVHATLALSRLPCGAWCTAGTTACEGDGVAICEEQADGCVRWSTPVACSAAAPYCSFGTCDVSCTDECALGEGRCDGPEGAQSCGQADSDPCLDWMPSVACAQGETCVLGSCTAECRDECADGAVRCQDSGVSICGDRNFDGCTEWGPTEGCANGESCQAGVCAPIGECTDECAMNECSGAIFTQCGNFDLDPCFEPSPGLACEASDPCMEGSCSLEGCGSVPRVCDEPPPAHCMDPATLRAYQPTGICSAGACTYDYVDTACNCAEGVCEVDPGCAEVLVAPADGFLDRTTGSVGDVATYSCRAGFYLAGNEGSKTRTCQEDGQWSGTALTCVSAAGYPMWELPGTPGVARSYTVGASTVIDNVTGLEWERAVREGWFTQSGARSNCDALVLDGRDDWRLPTRMELASIVDYGRAYPAIDSAVFPSTPSERFWSTSRNAAVGWGFDGWQVSFHNGMVFGEEGTIGGRVRCVRGTVVKAAPIEPRFTVNADDDTVTDHVTGLVWRRTLSSTGRTFDYAASYCASLGGSWRVPSILELLSIVDPNLGNPAIDPALFPETDFAVWSSSRVYSDGSRGWILLFRYNGWADTLATTETLRVRCVR